MLFFGSDRLDNSGDAQQGFWFFQNQISLGGASRRRNRFTGVHKTSDLLVLSDFSNGGGTSTISVYAWDPTCTSGGNNPGRSMWCHEPAPQGNLDERELREPHSRHILRHRQRGHDHDAVVVHGQERDPEQRGA